MDFQYWYNAHVLDVYDGDTITLSVDLGFNIGTRKTKVRLYRINTPEVRGVERPKGLISRDWLRARILNKEIAINTYKDKKGKYGRWLADVYMDETCLNDEMVTKGLAVYKDYS